MAGTNIKVLGLPTDNIFRLFLIANFRHFWPGQIRMAIYHGSNRLRQSAGLLKNDIVITTYETLRHEWTNDSENSVLFADTEPWARVVLDEGGTPLLPTAKQFPPY